MEGAALRQEREYDLAITQAWNTAMFAINGYGGKLKDKTLADYLINKPPKKQSSSAAAVAFFHSMKSAGFDVKIERVERKPSE